MPLLALAVLGLMFLGSVLGNPTPGPSEEPSAAAAPQPASIAVKAEVLPTTVLGVVQSVDPQASQLTVRTEVGHLVPVTVESCTILRGLQPGDRVRLAIGSEGTVYAMEISGPRRPRLAEDVAATREPDACQGIAS